MREPLAVLATVVIIVIGKSIAAFLIVRAFGHPTSTALVISASLAQIGEFSFILAGLGLSLGLLPREGNDLILAGAIISIMVNPLIFVGLDRLGARDRAKRERAEGVATAERRAAEMPTTSLCDHVVLVGHGRVGSLIATDLRERGVPFLVIEENEARVARLREDGIEAIRGEARVPGVLQAANLTGARWLVSAIPSPFEASTLIEAAKAANPDLRVIARAHSDAEVEHLQRYGATQIVLGEREIAREMTARLLAGDAKPSVPDDGDLAPDGDAFENALRKLA